MFLLTCEIKIYSLPAEM